VHCEVLSKHETGLTESRQAVMQILKAGVFYFALVFGNGFVLGVIRQLWIVPRFGIRTGELIEAPIMLVVTILAARFVARGFEMPPRPSKRLPSVLLRLASCLSWNSRSYFRSGV